MATHLLNPLSLARRETEQRTAQDFMHKCPAYGRKVTESLSDFSLLVGAGTRI